jgi:acylphosphatase
MDNIRVRLFIKGRVQGVWFRDSTRQEAIRLGITGWARNIPDGRVEVLAEGPVDKVRSLIDWCQQGPPLARVDQVEESFEEWTAEFNSFNIVFQIWTC